MVGKTFKEEMHDYYKEYSKNLKPGVWLKSNYEKSLELYNSLKSQNFTKDNSNSFDYEKQFGKFDILFQYIIANTMNYYENAQNENEDFSWDLFKVRGRMQIKIWRKDILRHIDKDNIKRDDSSFENYAKALKKLELCDEIFSADDYDGFDTESIKFNKYIWNKITNIKILNKIDKNMEIDVLDRVKWLNEKYENIQTIKKSEDSEYLRKGESEDFLIKSKYDDLNMKINDKKENKFEKINTKEKLNFKKEKMA